MMSQRLANFVVAMVLAGLVVGGLFLLLLGMQCLSKRGNAYTDYMNGYTDKPASGVVK